MSVADARAYLTGLYRGTVGYAEVRVLSPDRSRIIDRDYLLVPDPFEVDRLAEVLVGYARHGHVLVSVLPRDREAGTRDAVPAGTMLWVDLDMPAVDAGRKLGAVGMTPTMVVSTGRGVHAYFALNEAVDRERIEQGNRRLAHLLGGDLGPVTADKCMRPPGTLNHKYDPPLPVSLVFGPTDVSSSWAQLVGGLPDPPEQAVAHRQATRRESYREQPAGDERLPAQRLLRSIPPQEYVPLLTGRELRPDGFMLCPLHEERTPSFRVHDMSWRCFGCDKRGDIYKLASELWNLPLKGRGFVRLHSELCRVVLGVTA